MDVLDLAEFSDDEGEEASRTDTDEAAEDLATLGVAVVRAFDEIGRAHWEERIYAAMDEFPEYKLRGRDVQRVLGGFGALGNPSSFHHPTVRTFRRMRKKLLFRPLFAAYALRQYGAEDARARVKLEALFDRLCVRCERFNRPVAEAWHRDIYGAEKYKLRALPATLPGAAEDLLFGGWTNMDHREQRFVGLLATHRDAHTPGKGFAEFSAAEIAKYRFPERLQAQADKRFGRTIRTDAKGYVRVPPGHCVLFQQQLVHSVVSGPQPETPALRVFHGLRLTGETVPLFDVAAAVENGGVPRIPSGQIPPMFSTNHYSFFASHERYREWAGNTFKRACLFERVTKQGIVYYTPGSQGNRNRAANTGRYMPSLAEMGLWDDRFAYSEWELRAMHPQPLF